MNYRNLRRDPDKTTKELLLNNKVASRIAAKDATLYDFSEIAKESAENFMGWTDLATNPRWDLDEISEFAFDAIADGLERVILIGQGGSSQAPMTITKLNAENHLGIRFTTLDSLSPIYVEKVLSNINLKNTIFVVSSKSGTTREVSSMLEVLWAKVADELGEKCAGRRFVAITDPGSKLEQIAHDRRFRGCFLGLPDIGGRFSALSVFGLVPAALAGLDIHELVNRAAEFERACSVDNEENPATNLACFLYDNVQYESGYVFSYLSPQPGRVFGLWMEQLIAESLGKDGHGIVPHIEIDTELLNPPMAQHPAIIYHTSDDPEFEREIKYIENSVPTHSFTLHDPLDICGHFIVWEYATAMLGWLMKVPPFNQPDVQLAKTATTEAIKGNLINRTRTLEEPWARFEISDALEDACKDVSCIADLIDVLFMLTKPYNWVSVNAFLPFTGERRGPIEVIRHTISMTAKVPSSLEIGPRYMHSTGQLQKGGYNNGIYLIISSTEDYDYKVPGQPYTLDELQTAQARGDLSALSDCGRKAIHIHLQDSSATILWKLAYAIEYGGTRCTVQKALKDASKRASDSL